ncbi:Fe-S cluster assembly sulfur transfer protein SufU [Ornithinimicrobium pekingense]|uniref:Iron-sulfur cluster assembly scaffold protein NifU n=1 Tax=Ornithinimicrobium pekingense TaxID=384677 RepID=A0ABQ2FCS1_9MICO|nr:SUF system NifU family Fe-S cluster assembly protein [Ornithinimicrobium pekingense]GGK74817.1 iron-sulfur cluster assembly scaffold protein NifU [Ornithinimicrobium pekingense]
MDLYGELILDHARRPQHAGLREPYDVEVNHVNPTCGDEISLRVHLVEGPDGAGPVLQDVSYDALGCSISVASASVLAEECLGRPLADTLTTYRHLHAMLTSKGTDPGDPEQVGDGVAFAGVARYPARVKCALLPWSAYLDALARAGADISSASTSTPSAPTMEER